jgi:hypothetical protein
LLNRFSAGSCIYRRTVVRVDKFVDEFVDKPSSRRRDAGPRMGFDRSSTSPRERGDRTPQRTTEAVTRFASPCGKGAQSCPAQGGLAVDGFTHA